ncbi:Signal transduction response regulator receiver domain [Arabidopsis suecica]|uniref:Signal transduction response regulator receiver domain n=1 Tax=Arabidopsis suecica TaxID=45249 RepID=A0A8T1XXG8_ARASU|nr:Signal transduction response regulator receiver domain [Arabidopsis suecica]
MTAKDSSAAVTTLRGQFNKIDVVITDYHMPDLNGVQLKQRIAEEFGNLPMILTDLDRNIEHEALSCGALCIMRQPISNRDLNVVCEQVLRLNVNGETDPNGSKQNGKRPPTNDSDDKNHWLRLREKPKLKWTKPLQARFMRALKTIGVASKY